MEFLKATDELDFSFYRIPKNFKDLAKQGISHTAILLYGLLLDRWELSKKNKNDWSNEKDEVFLYFGRDAAAEELCVSKKTIIKAFRELTERGLIFEKRQGQNKPNMIFLIKTPVIQGKGTFSTSENNQPKQQSEQWKTMQLEGEEVLQTEHQENPEVYNLHSSEVENLHLGEVENLHPNDTNINDTEFNDTKIIRVDSNEPTRPLPSPSYELSLEAWEYFKSEYSERRIGKAEEHPPYRPDQLEDYLLTLSAFIEDNGLHYDELQGMIQLHFNTQYQKGCNYRFAHFCTEGVLKNRMFEQRREPDHY